MSPASPALAEAYLALLPRLERRSVAEGLLARLLPLAITGFGLAFYFHQIHESGSQLGGAFLPPWLHFGYAGLLALMGIGIAAGLGAKLPKVAGQLEYSDLAGRLARGEMQSDAIFEHTRPWFRWLLPRGASDDHWKTLLRVAGSLEWYLGPPRPHMRQSWRMVLGMLPLAAYLLVLWQMNMFSMFRSMPPTFAVMMFMGPLLASCSMLHQQRSRTALLVRYLREHLATGTLPTGTQVGESAAVTTRMMGMHLILNQLEQDLQQMLHRAMALPVMLGTFAVMPLFIYGMTGLFTGSLDWRILAAMAPLLAAPAAVFYGVQARRRSSLRSRLERSGLALRLASGELKHDVIFEHVPWALRWWLQFPRMPRAYADDLRLVLWRVATNLDWYLGPPRRLLRPAWIASLLLGVGVFLPLLIPLMLIGPLSGTLRPGILAGGNAAGDEGLVVLILLVVPMALLTIVMLEYQRLRLGSEELLRHLRERLAGAEQ